ncbi:hypothetical protein [Sphingobacterium bambusae]|uniref:Uncharacterized protein n=1 Tax=Sphingobacterium bambusae TaxID=662858 RepID=A0ABW6BCZ3_9SPHI|nr:hypothetical protein [Sphingobacterium bambusae]WPL48870.1 hypothetical protein SCB77_00115 [Sphingobacterium bambusae]
MMEINKKDEHIQKILDNQLPEEQQTADDFTDRDVKAYKLVFSALKQELETGPSYALSYHIQRVLYQKKQKARRSLLYTLLALVGMLLIAAAVVMLKYFPLFGLEQRLPTDYFWSVCFSAVLIILIKLLEYRALKKKWMNYRKH